MLINDRANLTAVANAPTRRQAIIGAAIAIGGLALGSTPSWSGNRGRNFSHWRESIHQEPMIHASPKRVYEALTEHQAVRPGRRISAAP